MLTTHVDELLGVCEPGVVLLKFTLGMEMQPRALWTIRRCLLGLGPLEVLLTGAALALALPVAVAGG